VGWTEVYNVNTETLAIPALVTEAESTALLEKLRVAQQALGERALIPTTGQQSKYRWTSGFKVLRRPPRPQGRALLPLIAVARAS
jgi:hypothetical protein